MQCDRKGCNRRTPQTGTDLYCSDRCYDLDNDPNPIQPLARNKAGGFGNELSRAVPQPVHLPRKEA